jgi:hypothetical protein
MQCLAHIGREEKTRKHIVRVFFELVFEHRARYMRNLNRLGRVLLDQRSKRVQCLRMYEIFDRNKSYDGKLTMTSPWRVNLAFSSWSFGSVVRT